MATVWCGWDGFNAKGASVADGTVLKLCGDVTHGGFGFSFSEWVGGEVVSGACVVDLKHHIYQKVVYGLHELGKPLVPVFKPMCDGMCSRSVLLKAFGGGRV